jgi:tRNA pseudouridine38-40 synthase
MDYKSVANISRDKNRVVENTVRTIYRFDVVENARGEDGLVRLEVEGNGFLYRQVRNMVGACITVATGKYDLDYLQRLIDAKDRTLAPMGAPAHGLFLHKVFYPESVLRKPADWNHFNVSRDSDAIDGVIY